MGLAQVCDHAKILIVFDLLRDVGPLQVFELRTRVHDSDRYGTPGLLLIPDPGLQ